MCKQTLIIIPRLQSGHIYYSRYTEIQYINVCRVPEIISEIGDMEHKYLNSLVHHVVSLIKVLNQNPQFQHLNT